MLHRTPVALLFVSLFELLLVGANAESKQVVATGKMFEAAIADPGEYACAGGQKVVDSPDLWACSPETRVLHVWGARTVWVSHDVAGTGAALFYTLAGVNHMHGKPHGPAIRDAMKRKMEMIKSMRKP